MLNKRVVIHGHRGARGLYPENTLPAFMVAARLGVNALEMDVVISADRQVVVSHEAWMNGDFCTLPNGLPVAEGRQYNLFKMPYAQIKTFDCGIRHNAQFPEQRSTPAYKPLLAEVIAAVELFTQGNKLPPMHYNIELKSDLPDGEFNPPAPEFAALVNEELKNAAAVYHDLRGRVHIQSFDVRLLQAMRSADPAMSIGLLVEDQNDLSAHLKSLGFMPGIYSPEYVLVNEALIKEVHRLGMKLIPWTVNEKAEMQQLISWGVDGIITDYPDRALDLVNDRV